MSTKIYNGHRLSRPMALEELHLLLRGLGDEARERASDAIADKLAQGAVFLADQRLLAGEEHHGDSPLRAAFRPYQEAADRLKKGLREPKWDMSLDIVVFPFPGGRHLLMAFHDRKEWQDLLEARVPIQDYHYQNQTDHPEDITDEEWDEREVAWADALDDYRLTPAQAGLGMALIPVGYLLRPTVEQIAARVPSLERRAAEQARRSAIKENVKSRRDCGEPLGASRMAEKWLATDEGKARLAELEEEMRRTLPENPGASYLTGHDPKGGQ